ncbi:hypothetical protein U9M48_036736 [Paspalum notatum var. saurae]|uniref:Uncharacterized protein n=1 Tax=Paspalum notatum var. saurae TaxID=547442 RepID=A0AAQ3UDP2_PASNO
MEGQDAIPRSVGGSFQKMGRGSLTGPPAGGPHHRSAAHVESVARLPSEMWALLALGHASIIHLYLKDERIRTCHDKRIKGFNSSYKLFGHGKLRSKWEVPNLVINASTHGAIMLQDDDGNVFKG